MQMYKIRLDSKIATNFRNTVNRYINLSIAQKYKRKNNKETNAWNTICSIMDRVDDLICYLNEKELNNGQWKRCAFDFFEFIEQAGVLVQCIDDAFKIYEIDFPQHGNIFKSKKINKNTLEFKKKDELDDLYFKYIRSLSSVHPSDTDRHRIFQETDFEVSPYVVWNEGIFTLNNPNADLVLVTYNNETSEFLTNKAIIISEVFNYIKYKYYSLNYLSKCISQKYEKIIDNFRNTPIKKPSDFDDYILYLKNIKKEALSRNPDMECDIQEVIDIFSLNLTNDSNTIKFDKYKNSLKYAFQAIHRQLQNMDFNCNSPIDQLLGDLLLGNIYFDDDNYHYPLSKILYLKEETGDKMWGIKMYKLLLSVFKKYIDISERDLYNLEYNELYILSQIALYHHALEFECNINYMIPDSDNYRC